MPCAYRYVSQRALEAAAIRRDVRRCVAEPVTCAGIPAYIQGSRRPAPTGRRKRMIAVPNRQPDDRPPPRSTGGPLTVSIHLAVSALVLTTILLTAAASSLLWWRTAEATSRQLASTINEQIVAAVRKEVSAIVGEARGSYGHPHPVPAERARHPRSRQARV